MTDAEKLARAIILFTRGGAWSSADHDNWRTYTGTPLALVRNLTLLAEKVIANEQRTSIPDPPGALRLSSPVLARQPSSPRVTTETLHHNGPEERTLWPVEPGSKLGGPDH